MYIVHDIILVHYNYCIRDSDQNHTKGKEMQEGKVVVWGSFTNSRERKGEVKGKGERQRYAQLNAEFQRIQRIAKRDKKPLIIIN